MDVTIDPCNLVNHRFVHRFLAVEKRNRSIDLFFDRKGELGRNEISREGLFVLNYKYPRFERRKDPCVLSGFPVLYHLDSPFTDL